MKKALIKLVGVVAVFTLALGIYSPSEHQQGSIIMLSEHGDGGG